MRHKVILDREVAVELGVDQRKVSRVTAEFIRQLGLHLAEYGVLSIEGLGSFRIGPVDKPHEATLVTGTFKKNGRREVRKIEIPSYLRVHFSKGPTLKKLLDEQYKESTMEKYGVDENIDQENLEKKAAKGCPECGSKLTKHGSILVCPKHGTEPFEDEHRGP